MSDKLFPLSLPKLFELTFSELKKERFLGIPRSLFFKPLATDPFRMERYGTLLETPVGVAAGPQTQLSENIIASWLCGARYIELKTIQTLDELEVSKPCIDMQDEGYNCEWSQELKIEQSFREYLNAWVMIHILHRELGFEGQPGVLFNMSAGYNMEGILKENVQWFFDKMQDCHEELAEARKSLLGIYPEITSIVIPACISNHITLSTMHGCPPDEIEKIGLYLINEKKFHTTIKLNPTLLGPEVLRGLLNGQMGFTAEIPDLAFEHDLKYPDALVLIKRLMEASEANGLHFSLKLTNTLESKNNKSIFPEKEQMMYLSGRALHPVSIHVARKLQNEFGGELDLSFSAGIDCFNIADVLACGLKPVTVCSDLLKPGGYGRLAQYFEHLRQEFEDFHSGSIGDFIQKSSGNNALTVKEAALQNLNSYADRVALQDAFIRSAGTPDIKTNRELGPFDCIHAPCKDTCPTNQDIPGYMYHTAAGDIPSAFETVFATNPFPSITGMVCDHLCQYKCTRINYDESLHIREVKRFIAENHPGPATSDQAEKNGRKAAIIGAGPAGLSCGWFLAKAGFEVHLYEQKAMPGGMVSAAIPSFRLTDEAIDRDIQRVLAAGITLHDNYRITRENFNSLYESNHVVFMGAGAQRSAKLDIEGINTEGVFDPLDFLFKVKTKDDHGLGKNVVIIGGGNTAMDAARTAYRLVGKEGKVTIVYRRTINEMPADKGEIAAVREEGIEILGLTNPERILSENGRVSGIACSKNILAMKGKDGRMAPIKIPDSEFKICCDTIIPAIGQQLDIDFIDPEKLKTARGSYQTVLPKLFIGGDALRGASTAINAIGDGRKAAAEILQNLPDLAATSPTAEKAIDIKELLHRKSVRMYGARPKETALNDRQNFTLVMSSYTEHDARNEAARCLQCDEICNVCVSVCPNLANFSHRVKPVFYNLQKVVVKEFGIISHEKDVRFELEQEYQILNLRDLCNECGNCATFCPSSGKPYKDKPGLSLSMESFKSEKQGYFLSTLDEKKVLIYKEGNIIRTLTMKDGRYIYETDQIRATINPADFSLAEVKVLTPCVKEFSFAFAAEMSVVMQGALQIS